MKKKGIIATMFNLSNSSTAKTRLFAFLVLIIGAGLGYVVFADQTLGWKPFHLGLDLSGGTQLTYRAVTTNLAGADVKESMSALRDTIERRVNMFGVSEPIVQTEQTSAISGTSEQRLIVELPGVTDTQLAITLIGQTPVLEFRMMKEGVDQSKVSSTTPIGDLFDTAAITGKDLASAQMQFLGGQGRVGSTPAVALKFNAEGSRKFADLTKSHVGKVFGIFLDGQPISTPVIREAIPDGTAIISGSFTIQQAKELSRNLNYGALPVPIELISTQTVSGTLGSKAVSAGLLAALWGIGAVALFMLIWYRLPGLLASIALLLYIIMTLLLFQWIPVTLTAAGIAAFILSVGMAVDANILIFERMKEELHAGKGTQDAIRDGFARAWPSIRDSNISSIITATILFWFGTSLIKGFALVFGLGVLISMLTAVSVSRTFLFALGLNASRGFTRFLFSSGISTH